MDNKEIFNLIDYQGTADQDHNSVSFHIKATRKKLSNLTLPSADKVYLKISLTSFVGV